MTDELPYTIGRSHAMNRAITDKKPAAVVFSDESGRLYLDGVPITAKELLERFQGRIKPVTVKGLDDEQWETFFTSNG